MNNPERPCGVTTDAAARPAERPRMATGWTHLAALSVIVLIGASCGSTTPTPPVTPTSQPATASTATAEPTAVDVIDAFLAAVNEPDAAYRATETLTLEIGTSRTSGTTSIDRDGNDVHTVATLGNGTQAARFEQINKDDSTFGRIGDGPWHELPLTEGPRLPLHALSRDDLTLVGATSREGRAVQHLAADHPIPFDAASFLGTDLAGSEVTMTDVDAYVLADGTPVAVDTDVEIGLNGTAVGTATLGLEFNQVGGSVAIEAPTVKPTLVIISSQPRQVNGSPEDRTIHEAINAAVDERDLINGWTISVDRIDEDTAETEWSRASAALLEPSVVAYVGPTLVDTAMVSIPLTCRAGVAEVGYELTYAGFTRPIAGQVGQPDVWYQGCQHNFFRVATNQDTEARAGATWAARQGARRIWIVSDGSTSLDPMFDRPFRQQATVEKLAILGSSSVPATSTRLGRLAKRIVRAKPDLIYFIGSWNTATTKLWRAVHGAAPKLGLLGTSWIWEDGGAGSTDAETAGFKSTARWVAYDKRGAADDHFASLVSGDTRNALTAVYAYDAMRVVLDAIDRATADGETDLAVIRKRVLDEVAATHDFQSSVGLTWSFDAAGDTKPSLVEIDETDAEGYINPVTTLVLP
jgi:branched-chain amino acid transport system substrate-binding protein